MEYGEQKSDKAPPPTAAKDAPMEVLSLSLTVIQGDGLVAKDKNLLGQWTTSDPYVAVSLFPMGLQGPEIKLGKSQVIRCTLSPQWDEEFQIEVPVMSVTEDLQFQITIFDWDEDLIKGVVQSEHSLMGVVPLNVPPQMYCNWSNPPITKWYGVPVRSAKRASGRIQCKLQVIKSMKKRDEIAKTVVKEPQGKPKKEVKDKAKQAEKEEKQREKALKKAMKKEKKLAKKEGKEKGKDKESKKKKALKKLKATLKGKSKNKDKNNPHPELNKALSSPNLMGDDDDGDGDNSSDSSSDSSDEEAGAIYAAAVMQGVGTRRSIRHPGPRNNLMRSSSCRMGDVSGRIDASASRNITSMDISTSTRSLRGGGGLGRRAASARNLMGPMDASTNSSNMDRSMASTVSKGAPQITASGLRSKWKQQQNGIADNSETSPIKTAQTGNGLVSARRGPRENLGPPITGEEPKRKGMRRRSASARNPSQNNARPTGAMDASIQSVHSKKGKRSGGPSPKRKGSPKPSGMERSSSARQIDNREFAVDGKANASGTEKSEHDQPIKGGNLSRYLSACESRPEGLKRSASNRSFRRNAAVGLKSRPDKPDINGTEACETTNSLEAASTPTMQDNAPAPNNHSEESQQVVVVPTPQENKLVPIQDDQMVPAVTDPVPDPVQIHIPPKSTTEEILNSNQIAEPIQPQTIPVQYFEQEQTAHKAAAEVRAGGFGGEIQLVALPSPPPPPPSMFVPQVSNEESPASQSPRSVGADPESAPGFYLDADGVEYYLDKNGVEYYRDPNTGAFYADGYGSSGRTESDFGFFYDADGREYFVDHTGKEHYKDEDDGQGHSGFFVDSHGREYFLYENVEYYKDHHVEHHDIAPETGFFLDADGLEYYLDTNGVEYYKNPMDGEYYAHGYQNAERGMMLQIEHLPAKDRLEWEARHQGRRP